MEVGGIGRPNNVDVFLKLQFVCSILYMYYINDDHRPIIAEENLEKFFLARNYISFISQT